MERKENELPSNERVFAMDLTPAGTSSVVLLDGNDISNLLRGVEVRSSVDQPTQVTLLVAPGRRAQLVAMLPESRVAVLPEVDAVCETCRWWKPHAPGVGYFGDCQLFECKGNEQVHSDSKLIVTRTQSGEATLVTAEDFGCVQWVGGRE